MEKEVSLLFMELKNHWIVKMYEHAKKVEGIEDEATIRCKYLEDGSVVEVAELTDTERGY